ncbi:MAG: HRDC domain-containing protein [bacterium]|nr:HRDC domain-containing protein [bacterium]
MSESYTLISDRKDLDPLLLAVAAHDTVALDTEADNQHHYREKLCLLQFTVGGRNWIVDPLAGPDLESLMGLLARRELLIHGADYDLRLLYRTYRFRPERVFDTMLAAQLLGRPQIGLAALVGEICQVNLSKHAQRADWSRRPLPPELLAYAADDTRYLGRVAAAMRRELAHAGRLPWHAESCRRTVAAAGHIRQSLPEDPWRIKGGKHYTGRAAAVLRALWHWREEVARRNDRPPFKIARPDFLLEWAEWAAGHPDAGFEDAPTRPAWLHGARLHAFDSALERALAMPAESWPASVPPRHGSRLSRDQETRLKSILARRDALARDLRLDPGVLGSRDVLKELILGCAADSRPPDHEAYAHAGLMEWQIELLRPLIEPLLERADTVDQ